MSYDQTGSSGQRDGSGALFAGPFTRQMAIDAGLGAHELRELVRAKQLRFLLRGVLIQRDVPVDLDVRLRALGLVVPPDGVVVDRTAAWLHGVDVQRRASVHRPQPLEVFLDRDSRLRRAGVDSGRRAFLPRDLVEIGGLVATSPLRTALDLSRGLWRPDALGAIDQFLRLGLSIDQLLLELRRFRGHRGVVQARAVIPLGDPRADSMAESALRWHWWDAGLPRPEPQLEIRDSGVLLYRLDLTDPEVGYCAEYDGAEFHTAEEDRAYDEARRAWCRDVRGWEIDVLTKEPVYQLRPDPTEILSAGWHRARLQRTQGRRLYL